ncbi:MAG: Response regulator receiver protein, partial [Clostridia bacterium 62_21]
MLRKENAMCQNKVPIGPLKFKSPWQEKFSSRRKSLVQRFMREAKRLMPEKAIKVLIADDNREFCETLAEYLRQQADFEVV